MASSLTSRLTGLSIFSKSKKPKDDNDDEGEQLDVNSVAGGHSRRSDILKGQLRISPALTAFLVNERVLTQEDAGTSADQPTIALRELLSQPHVQVPPSLTDRSHPLPEYFISSSHNTYLTAHQLFGTSSAAGYEVALNTGSRCVEIDAWDDDDNKDEPKVTHGFTLVSHIPFRVVCETIKAVVDKEASEFTGIQDTGAASIFLSLENHCDAHGQMRLVDIMKEIWGDRLLSGAVRAKGHEEQEGGQHISLGELGSKIVVIVEYHFPGEPDDSDSDSSDSEDEAEKKAREDYKQKKKEAPTAKIIPELAAMGVYAQSVKPADNSWFEEVLKDAPHHHLINVSESGLGSHLPAHSEKISRHNSEHLMRVFPKGTRISSQNLHPVPFWGIGAQICALNWQTFGAAMQVNEALFGGTDGFVLKPEALRPGGSGKLSTGRKKKLSLRIAGASEIPIPTGRDSEIKPYVTCSLVHPDELTDTATKRKTSAYKKHKLPFLHSGEETEVTDPVWDETLEWEYEDNELVFLRILVKSDDKFAGNPTFATAAVRLSYVLGGWKFIRLLDLKGRETSCSLLVRFEIRDV